MIRYIPLCSLSLISYFDKKEKTEDECIKAATDKSAKLIKVFKEKCGIPGISVSVNFSGKAHINISTGYCDVENLEKSNPESAMRIASISKSFSSIMAAMLMEEGLLDFDVDIRQYLPEFPTKYINNKKVDITSRQILSHRAGIRHYKDEENNSEYESSEFLSTKRCSDAFSGIDIFQNDDLKFQPGEKYYYSSFGYVLIGAILERLGKQSKVFSAKKDGEIKDHSLEKMFRILFKKLGLKNTYCEYHENILYNRSRQYRRVSSKQCQLQIAPYVDNSCKWGSGGLVSTCQDLNKFAEHLVLIWLGKENGIIHKNTLRVLWTSLSDNLNDRNEGYGLGWSLKQENERFVVGHLGGASGGTSALMICFPENDKSKDYIIVSILCNLEKLSERVGDLAMAIINEFEKIL